MKNDVESALLVLQKCCPEKKEINVMLKKSQLLINITDIKIESCRTCLDFLHIRDVHGRIFTHCKNSGELKNGFEKCSDWRGESKC
jgi:hypothetical protein